MAPQFENLPILDALREISKDKSLADKIKGQLRGRIFSKMGQAEFVDNLLAFDMAASILPQLQISEEQLGQFLNRLDVGTPELRRATGQRREGARQEKRLRDAFAREGSVRTRLFGGDVGGEQVPGLFKSVKRPGLEGISDWTRRHAAKLVFESVIAAGGDPMTAADAAAGMFMSKDFEYGNTATSTSQNNMIQREMRRLESDVGSPMNDIQKRQLRAIEHSRRANERAAEAAEAAAGAANAAAQKAQQQE